MGSLPSQTGGEQMTDEKICPFCGSDDIETFYNRSGVDHYTCQYCGATAKQWNTRHEPDDVNRMRNLLEDVVNALDLSELAIETHRVLGTEPAKLVKLVLQQKDREIALLHHELDGLPEWAIKEINTMKDWAMLNPEYGFGFGDACDRILSLRKPENK
jgi:Zn ribbon nucleic-acid-binding protein